MRNWSLKLVISDHDDDGDDDDDDDDKLMTYGRTNGNE